MTANVAIVVAQKDHVLKVPNAALRFSPPQSERPDGRGQDGSGAKAEGRTGGGRSGASSAESGGQMKKIWKLGMNGEPEPLIVQTGISDGVSTEIVSGSAAEGDMVIVGVETARGERKTGELPPGFGGGQRRSSRDRGL
jgi:HlyD family secretion protein